MVVMALAPALFTKLPVAANTMLPAAWLLVMVAPALRVMLPPVSSVVLSTNALVPPTVMAPASAAPNTMSLKPFLNTEVPVNKLFGNNKVPAPEPMPMLAPTVEGRIDKMPLL